jgi:wyosine [tRNA(Phe)-imidazoG37] synthetase (radical SAM superfamily)
VSTLVFGPVPSRRLGRSLGINSIPPKLCTYSCVYCQVGRTIDFRADRGVFYEPQDVLAAVKERFDEESSAKEKVDYLTFVPDGEPTLDLNQGREIELLRPLGIPIAVITNSSLIWQETVRDELKAADWVSLKMDAVDEPVWRYANQPHNSLNLQAILDGAFAFSRSYEGKLVAETMLVAGVNDREESLHHVALYLRALQPSVAYLAIPTRPPAERRVRAPEESIVNSAYQIVKPAVRALE